MATQYDNAIQQLYVAYFNRPADASGITFWANAMANGVTTTQISAAFAASAEYQTEYSDATYTGVVSKVYQNLFGHAPDSTGLAFWVKALNDKTLTIDNVVDYIARGAQGTDADTIAAKVKVATAFTNALDTNAEKAGYAGTEANNAAKALLATIKTDTQANAAIVPATLDASVAAVIKAGVPFTLANGLAALGAADKALADFYADAEVVDADGEEIEEVDYGVLETNLGRAEATVDGLIFVGDYAGSRPGVQAALIAEQQAANAEALEAEQEDLADARAEVAKVSGLGNAIAALTTATEAAEDAVEAAAVADAAEQAALTTVQARNTAANITLRTTVEGVEQLISTVPSTTPDAPATVTVLANVNADGTWVIPSTVKASDYVGLTAFVAAGNANTAAAAESVEAAENALFAELEVNTRDITSAGTNALKEITFTQITIAEGATPTVANIRDELSALRSKNLSTVDFLGDVDDFLEANTTSRANLVTTEEGQVEAAQKAITDLADALENLESAQALLDQADSLIEARDAAIAEFDANDYNEPNMLAGAEFGTTGSDIFVFNNAAATITSFGRSGDDVLYVGAGYTLNEGALSTGNDAVLEVFFNQRGNNAEVIIETKAYGSDSGATQTITLTGVNVEDLTFENGIITL